MKKVKKPTVTKLKKTLDQIVSLYIRKRAEVNGKIICITCRRQKNFDEIQAGHFISRSHLNTRWSLNNIFPQCISCNIFKHGAYPEFAKHLLDTFGEKWLQKLIEDGRKIQKWTTTDLQNKIQKYQTLLKNL